jgi:hypothetical protein
MHNLVDIIALFKEHDVRIIERGGWFFTTQKNNDPVDRWTMSHDVTYLNDQAVGKQDVLKYAKLPDNYVYRPSKKIAPKEGYENDCESTEADYG